MTDDLTVIFALSGSSHLKAEHKMLMKLTTGLNFINILHTTFMHVDLECAKKTVKSA
jgi:hypothetical protein